MQAVELKSNYIQSWFLQNNYHDFRVMAMIALLEYLNFFFKILVDVNASITFYP